MALAQAFRQLTRTMVISINRHDAVQPINASSAPCSDHGKHIQRESPGYHETAKVTNLRESISSPVGHSSQAMNAKPSTDQSRYSRNFARTFRQTLQLYPRKHFFLDRPPVQMADPARDANLQLANLLPKTFGTCTPISATIDTFTLDDNDSHNTVSVDVVTFAPFNARSNDRNYRGSYLQDANHRREKNRTD